MRGENTVIRQTYAILTFASSFYHGSETHLGERQDGMSNALFAFILHQAMLDSVPYSPVLHDLSHSPRNQTQPLQIRDQLTIYIIDGTLIPDGPGLSFPLLGAFSHNRSFLCPQ